MNNFNYKVFYINLDKRNDRNDIMKKNLNNIFPMNNIKRFSAYENNFGALGCAQSHLEILKKSRENNYDFVIICEDDIEWELNNNEIKNYFDNCINYDFNILSFSYHIPAINMKYNKNKYISEATNIQMCSGYIVKKNIINELISLWELSIKNLNKKNQNIFAIDQIWKKLQTPENKFFVTKVRLAKQRKDYSNIENRNVNYLSSSFLIILTCEKYKVERMEKHKKQLENCNFNYRYFIGNTNIRVPIDTGEIVYLPCGDNYEDLPDKTYESLKWVTNNYKSIDYIFKTDDDIELKFNNIYKLFQKLMVKGINYAGNGNIIKEEIETKNHFGKCKNKKLNKKKFILKKCIYNSGGLYFLSKLSIDILLKNFNNPKYNYIYEDYKVGLILNDFKIKCVKIPNMKNYANWEGLK